MKNKIEMLQQSPMKKQKIESSEHGGSLKNARKRQRPLSVTKSMHLVLRSKHATKVWSFKKYEKQIDQILEKFAVKNQIQIRSRANVGNHIHMHLQILKRKQYNRFIRAITAAIVIEVTGFSKWRPKPEGFQFWDTRPFSRIVQTIREFKNLVDYIQINVLEGMGYDRDQARAKVKRRWSSA